jgi:hypothetical protein
MIYATANKLFGYKKFKDIYKVACNKVMESEGSKIHEWVLHSKNNKYGLKDGNGYWCWRNTINTHPNCFVSLNKFSQELGLPEIDFLDESNWLENCTKFWEFLQKNWLLIFTNRIESKYHNELRLKTNRSWSVGQITTIAFLYVFREIFNQKKFKKIGFSFDRGDNLDFMGIDVELFTLDDEYITIQVKSGEFKERTSNFSLTSSINDLRAQANHYCYVDIQENNTSVVVFRKDKNKIEVIGDLFLFEKDLLVNKVINKNMEVPQTLQKILTFCFENKIVFDLKNEMGETNKMEWEMEPEKVVTITIGDFKDTNLGSYLLGKFNELKELFK